MIDIKQAVDAAKHFIADVYEKQDSDFQLEEVKRSEDGKFWLITLGFLRDVAPVNKLAAAIGPNKQRVYKIIKVDVESGDAVAMEIREVDYADA